MASTRHECLSREPRDLQTRRAFSHPSIFVATAKARLGPGRVGTNPSLTQLTSSNLTIDTQ